MCGAVQVELPEPEIEGWLVQRGVGQVASLCLSVSLSLCLSVSLSLCLSVSPSLCLSVLAIVSFFSVSHSLAGRRREARLEAALLCPDCRDQDAGDL